jgi:hypothetical protein
MPKRNGRRQEHTKKADKMAEHIRESARKEGRYKGRENEVAWATVHKTLSKKEAHGKPTRRRTKGGS